MQNSISIVRALIKENTGISVDMPDSTGKGGTSTNGNVVHSLLSEEKNLQVIVSLVPDKFQNLLHESLTRSYVILKVYNSSFTKMLRLIKNFAQKPKNCYLHLSMKMRIGYFLCQLSMLY